MESAAEPPLKEVDHELLALVRQVAAELHPGQTRREIALESRLEQDLGFDSLGRVELLARVEDAFAVKLPETALEELETVGDLLRRLRDAGGLVPARTTGIPLQAIPEAVGLPPQRLTTLTEVLAWHVAQHGERTHVHFYGRAETLSYAGLQQGAHTIAAALQARAVGAGQTVGIMLPTGREFFLCFFGCLLAGAIPVPLYPPDRLSRLAEHLERQAGILNNAEAVLLVTFAAAEPAGHLVRAKVPSLAEVTTAQSLLALAARPHPVRARADDIALLQYTSGSTGAPKGVVLTHANLLANIRAMGETAQVSAQDVFVSWLPLYHDMGLIGAWLGSLYFAFPLVLMSPLAFLGCPERWLKAIHEYRGTLSASPNFGYELCLRKVEDAAIAGLDLSRWRMAFNGAEPVSADTIERFCQRFGPYGFKRETMAPVYGLAECAVGLAFPPPGRGPLVERLERHRLTRDGDAIPSTSAEAMAVVDCGRPLPGYQIRVVDALGYEVPERKQGRLQFRGPSATSGYYRNPQATAGLRHDGWLDSGDLAFIAGGEVFVTGRVKDMIIRAGHNLYPQELEEAIGNLSGVRKGCVAVFASPDPHTGSEQLVIVAETNETDPASRQALRTRIDQLAYRLLDTTPDVIVLAPKHAVLKTSSGKIRRAATSAAYQHGVLTETEQPWRSRLQLARLGVEYAWRRVSRESAKLAFAARCWAVFAIGAALVLPLLAVLPSEGLRCRFAHRVARVAAKCCGIALRVEGVANIPQGRACVYVANHASYLDGLVLTATLPPPLAFTAKKELAANPLLRFALGRIGTQFIERFEIRETLGDATRLGELARQGRSLLFFPEGTLSREPGLRPFHAGAFKIAADAGLAVVPVALRGTRSMLRDGQWLPLKVPLSVTVLPAIQPAGNDWPALLASRDATRAAILQQCGEPDLAEAPSGGER
jgi:acyl carrier protein